MKTLSILCLAAWTSLAAVAVPSSQPADQTPAPKADKEAIEEVLAGLRSRQYNARQAAINEAVEIGEPIVPALLEMALDTTGQGSAEAQRALGKMGAKARAALPRLLELAGTRPPATHPGELQTTSRPVESRPVSPRARPRAATLRPALPRLVLEGAARPAPSVPSLPPPSSPRQAALVVLGSMGWAAGEVTPVLAKVTEDPAETEQARYAAVSALGGMGEEGLPPLRKLADGPACGLREKARQTLAATLQAQGIQTQAEYYAGLVEADMFDPRVPDYLRSAVRRGNSEPENALSEKVKTAYRSRLKEKPEAQLAWALARIIQDQLAGTALTWSAPGGRGTLVSPREDPAESHMTLAAALNLGLEHADKGSELQVDLGVALAKLRLLQGDLEAMNDTLKRLGWGPVPLEQRAFLAGPPAAWGQDLATQWTVSDEAMRSGDCGLLVRVEKDGNGLRGAHVLVKKRSETSSGRLLLFSRLSADTLLRSPQAVPAVPRDTTAGPADASANLRALAAQAASGNSSFGYGGRDRAATRYGVTDDSGEVKFEKLPEADVQIEVLVPTANFPDPGRLWDLWMEVEPGKMKQAQNVSGSDVVNPQALPAVVELGSGRTVNYPRLVVIPVVEFGGGDWAEADPAKFELSWPAARAREGRRVIYELEMALSGPGAYSANADYMPPAIRSTRQMTRQNHWAVGAKGVGGQRLSPGGIYAFRVVARDDLGEVLARSVPRRAWVAWPNRKSKPPCTDTDLARRSPIGVETTRRASFSLGDGRRETLAERVDRFLRESPEAFEREYVQVGKGWLAWGDGDQKGARKQLEDLVEALPEGCVPQATAAWLLELMENGEKPPDRLKLVPPRSIPADE